jgi:hypothetical protein
VITQAKAHPFMTVQETQQTCIKDWMNDFALASLTFHAFLATRTL